MSVSSLVPKSNVKGERIKVGSMMVPLDRDSVEYEVYCKGTSKPFSKIRVLFSYEFQAKGTR